jgi:hypothetical protein
MGVAVIKEGDPSIIDMDPDKSYASQIERKVGDDEMDAGPPLKDDPEFQKFFKVCILFELFHSSL